MFSGFEIFKAQFSTADMILISADAKESLICLTDENAYVVKTFKNDKSTFEIYGNVTDGCSSLSLNVGLTINVSTETTLFPINYNTDIVLKKGASFSVNNKFKFLTGSSLTIEEGAILNIEKTGQLIFYQEFHDKSSIGSNYKECEAAKLINDGTIEIKGTFGGLISATSYKETGKIIIDAEAVLEIVSKEGDGSRSGISFSFNETSTITEVAKASQVGTDSVTLEVGKTYNYDGKSWVIEA